MVSKGSMLTSFVGALILIGALIAVPWVGAQVESGENGIFTAGGLSLEPVTGVAEPTDVGGPILRVRDDGVAGLDSLGDTRVSCGEPELTQDHAISTIANLSTNLTIFGDEYASVVMPIGADTANCEPRVFAGTVGLTAFQVDFYWKVSQADLMESEVLSFVMNPLSNLTVSHYSVVVRVLTTTGIPAATGTVVIEDSADDFKSGEALTVPLTTQDRLLIDALTDPAVGEDTFVRVTLYILPADMFDSGELVIWDMDLEKTRDSALSSVNRLIMTNIIGAIVIGFGAVLALPNVDLSDMFPGGRSPRRDRKGETGVSSMTVVLVLSAAIVSLWWFGGFSSFGSAFTISILPLSLATLGVALVAFGTRGRANRGMVLVFASLAGLMGWILGLSVQSQWIAYDRLYVSPFLDVVTGNVTATSLFEFTAALVVAAQVFAIGVMAWNALSTIASDETVQLVR